MTFNSPSKMWVRIRRPGAGFEQLSVFADVRGIDLIGLVAPQLGAREVADLGGIDEAHDVPGLMERQRDAQAVASGCFQASVDLSDLVLGQPGNQLAPAIGRIGETSGARFRAGQHAGVDLETSMPRTASVILRFFSLGPYTATAPHRSTLYTGSAPQRVPGYHPA
jgi:hypothetical protein